MRPIFLLYKTVNDESKDCNVGILCIIPSRFLNLKFREPIDLLRNIEKEQLGKIATSARKRNDKRVEYKFHNAYNGVVENSEDLSGYLFEETIKILHEAFTYWDPFVKRELAETEKILRSKSSGGIFVTTSYSQKTQLIFEV